MDVIDLKEFYASDLGIIARRLLGQRLRAHWPDMSGLDVVGLGYALPYLGAWRNPSHMVACFMPARLGVARWPGIKPSAVSLVDEADMPLADSSIDRLLVIHCLEMTDMPEEMLAEIWRVLKPGGRLLLVVPNRRGMWARTDYTPFGQGLPFSRRQLTTYLRDAMLQPESWSSALYVPPSSAAFFRRSASIWERLGQRLWLGFSAGVLVVEASKQVYALTPSKSLRRTFRRLRPALAPATATATASFDGQLKPVKRGSSMQ